MTQGLITIVQKGRVFMKIICGCEGYNVPPLAVRIQELEYTPTPREIYYLALNEGLGCRDCLVVMTEKEVVFEGGEKLDLRYRKTFERKEFNPRWKYGTADYIRIVEIGE